MPIYSRTDESRFLRQARTKSSEPRPVVNFRAPPECTEAVRDYAAKNFLTLTDAILELLDRGLRAAEAEEADEPGDVEINPRHNVLTLSGKDERAESFEEWRTMMTAKYPETANDE